MDIINANLLESNDIMRIEEMSQIAWSINKTLTFDMSEITKPKGNTTVEIIVGNPSSSVDVEYISSDSDKIRRKKENYEEEIESKERQVKQLRNRADELIKQAEEAPSLDIRCKLENEAEELMIIANNLSHNANTMKVVVQELQQILDGLSNDGYFKKTYSMQKHGEYDPNADKIFLYVESPKNFKTSELLLSTLMHELFHAFYHKHQPCSTIREIDEAMVEFSMLSYLTFLKDMIQDTYYDHLLKKAEKSVENKKYGMGELPAYGFGCYLYDHCNKQGDWITAYYNKIGKIKDTDPIVNQYVKSLNPSYTDDEIETYNTLSTILFAKAKIGYVQNTSNKVGIEIVQKIRSNVEITGVTLPNGGCAINKVDIRSRRNSSIDLPPTIKGYPITDIWGSSFPANDRPITVRIPDSVTNINPDAFGDGYDVIYTDKDAFEYYDKVKTILKGYKGNSRNIIIPNNVTSIGPSAFENRHDIETIVIPDSVTHIWEKAFAGCAHLKDLVIPASVVFVGDNAFKDVVNVTNDSTAIGFPWGAHIIKDDFEYADGGMTILKRYLGKESRVSIPNSVSLIAPHAFENHANIDTIIIPESVSKIVVNAFDGCNRLKDVKVPSPVTFLAEETYNDSIKASPLKIRNDEFEYSDAGMTILWKYLGNSVNVTIPDTVTTIAPSAFENCHELQSITIPQSVTQIWRNAFANCYKLMGVIIPASVTYVGKDAFKNVFHVSYQGKNAWGLPWGAKQLYKNNDFVYADASMTSLLYYEGNSDPICIPNTVTQIDVKAFKGHNHLNISYNGIADGFPWGAATVFEYADINMTILKRYSGNSVEVVIPETVKVIGNTSFDNNSNIRTIVIPSSVTQIGERAFAGCCQITDIIIPDTVSTIGENAFKGVTFKLPYKGLVSGFPWGGHFIKDDFEFADADMTILKRYCGNSDEVVIPETVKFIGNKAFEKNSNIRTIVIPSSVTQIGERAFAGCCQMTDIIIPDTVSTIGENAFEEVTLNRPYNGSAVGFPWGAKYIVDGFKYADADMTILTKYSGNADIVDIPQTVKTIGNRAFRMKRNIKTVNIPPSVTRIGEMAFAGCWKLTDLMIPDSVSSIGENAFEEVTLNRPYNGSVVGFPWGATYRVDKFQYADAGMTILIGQNFGVYTMDPNTIPPSVIRIGPNVFNSVTFNKLYTGIVSGFPWGAKIVIDHFEYADADMSILKEYHGDSNEIVIPNTVKTINPGAFKDLQIIQSVQIPESVEAIGRWAFRRTSIRSIIIPDSVTQIEEKAFDCCFSLERIVLGKKLNVGQILKFIFSNCEGISYVEVNPQNPYYQHSPDHKQIIEKQTGKILFKVK